ncbi:MAG: hypothetical protein U5J78_03815 [Parasphingorhabdus sp.]|nr:hypothetical protein [Parasphingorhabdus sp.]
MKIPPLLIVLAPNASRSLLQIADQLSAYEHLSVEPTADGLIVLNAGMTFNVDIVQGDALRDMLLDGKDISPAADVADQPNDCIGISLGDNIKGGEGLRLINEALLSLTCALGEIVAAEEVIFCPARRISDFEEFCECGEAFCLRWPLSCNGVGYVQSHWAIGFPNRGVTVFRQAGNSVRR